MKPVLALVLVCVCITSMANPVYEKLCDINKYWTRQFDIDKNSLAHLNAETETQWIQLHLQLVEQTLSARSTASLSQSQKANRLEALNYLHEYWQAGRFPQNEEYCYRLPIFIDKYDNFCAVGYLVKATGYEHVSRMISEKTNLAYVKDMDYPELFAWADAYGFTVDELAWIQPSYSGPTGRCLPIGRGTDGTVYELFTDTVTQRLYIGGDFTVVDSTISTQNIAYLTESGGSYTWHRMGSGTGGNGIVKAIAVYNGKVFAAGDFGSSIVNVSYWDGTIWSAAGCISGIVNDLLVYKGDLYAAGEFDVCSSSTDINFAKWTGNAWQPIPGLSGRINTMEVVDSALFLGGEFKYNNMPVNAAKWDAINGFQLFSNPVTNEVNDFESFMDTVYIVCTKKAIGDSFILRKLVNNTWDSSTTYGILMPNNNIQAKTLCADTGRMFMAGDFHISVMGNPHIKNMLAVPPYKATNNYFMTDSTINKMTLFKGRIIAGGSFKTTLTGWKPALNGIGYYKPFGTYTPLKIAVVALTNSCGPDSTGFATIDVTSGEPPYKYLWSTSDIGKTITNMPAGVYKVTITDNMNVTDTATVVINAIMPDTSLTIINTPDGIIFSANSDSIKYSWYNCSEDLMVTGATQKKFKPTVPGRYALIATTPEGCTDTSECYIVTGIHDINRLNSRIYPNPVTNSITIEFNTPIHAHISLADVTGRVIESYSISGDKHTSFDMSSFANGIYILSVSDNKGETVHHKIMKN